MYRVALHEHKYIPGFETLAVAALREIVTPSSRRSARTRGARYTVGAVVEHLDLGVDHRAALMGR